MRVEEVEVDNLLILVELQVLELVEEEKEQLLHLEVLPQILVQLIQVEEVEEVGFGTSGSGSWGFRYSYCKSTRIS
jgi:hypothetical protein